MNKKYLPTAKFIALFLAAAFVFTWGASIPVTKFHWAINGLLSVAFVCGGSGIVIGFVHILFKYDEWRKEKP